MATPRSTRTLRFLLAAGLVAASGAVLPVTAAHAATNTVSLAVKGGSNNSIPLGTASGTVTGTGGGTSVTYSLTLCGQSTYPNTRVTITAGSGSASHWVSPSACETVTGTVTSSTAITSGSVTLSGSTFYPGNTHTTYSSTQQLSFPTSPPPTPRPTPSPTPATRTIAATATGGANTSIALGRAVGSVTATRGGTNATYAVELCGQSTYPSSKVQIVAGSATVTHTVYYQACQTFTGTLSSTVGISTATVTVSGSTFYPGNTYTTYTKTRNLYF